VAGVLSGHRADQRVWRWSGSDAQAWQNVLEVSGGAFIFGMLGMGWMGTIVSSGYFHDVQYFAKCRSACLHASMRGVQKPRPEKLWDIVHAQLSVGDGFPRAGIAHGIGVRLARVLAVRGRHNGERPGLGASRHWLPVPGIGAGFWQLRIGSGAVQTGPFGREVPDSGRCANTL